MSGESDSLSPSGSGIKVEPSDESKTSDPATLRVFPEFAEHAGKVDQKFTEVRTDRVAVGEDIFALYPAFSDQGEHYAETWERGTVQGWNSDGTYMVVFEDGTEAHDVFEDEIKVILNPIESSAMLGGCDVWVFWFDGHFHRGKLRSMPELWVDWVVGEGEDAGKGGSSQVPMHRIFSDPPLQLVSSDDISWSSWRALPRIVKERVSFRLVWTVWQSCPRWPALVCPPAFLRHLHPALVKQALCNAREEYVVYLYGCRTWGLVKFGLIKPLTQDDLLATTSQAAKFGKKYRGFRRALTEATKALSRHPLDRLPLESFMDKVGLQADTTQSSITHNGTVANLDLRGVPSHVVPQLRSAVEHRSSKFKGVRRNKSKFEARILFEGKMQHLGSYESEWAAAVMYARAEWKLSNNDEKRRNGSSTSSSLFYTSDREKQPIVTPQPTASGHNSHASAQPVVTKGCVACSGKHRAHTCGRSKGVFIPRRTKKLTSKSGSRSYKGGKQHGQAQRSSQQQQQLPEAEATNSTPSKPALAKPPPLKKRPVQTAADESETVDQSCLACMGKHCAHSCSRSKLRQSQRNKSEDLINKSEPTPSSAPTPPLSTTKQPKESDETDAADSSEEEDDSKSDRTDEKRMHDESGDDTNGPPTPPPPPQKRDGSAVEEDMDMAESQCEKKAELEEKQEDASDGRIVETSAKRSESDKPEVPSQVDTKLDDAITAAVSQSMRNKRRRNSSDSGDAASAGEAIPSETEAERGGGLETPRQRRKRRRPTRFVQSGASNSDEDESQDLSEIDEKSAKAYHLSVFG